MHSLTTRAIVLAGGLGKRMRQRDDEAVLTEEQRRAADTGVKSLLPMGGRPFLDYVLWSLADAGVTEVGLVVAPDHERLRSTTRSPHHPNVFAWTSSSSSARSVRPMLYWRPKNGQRGSPSS